MLDMPPGPVCYRCLLPTACPLTWLLCCPPACLPAHLPACRLHDLCICRNNRAGVARKTCSARILGYQVASWGLYCDRAIANCAREVKRRTPFWSMMHQVADDVLIVFNELTKCAKC